MMHYLDWKQHIRAPVYMYIDVHVSQFFVPIVIGASLSEPDSSGNLSQAPFVCLFVCLHVRHTYLFVHSK